MRRSEGTCVLIFFFNDTATTEIYTLSLHDALPISSSHPRLSSPSRTECYGRGARTRDRKSTRLNSSHVRNSYAVFCLKKKNTNRLLRYPKVESIRRLEVFSLCSAH